MPFSNKVWKQLREAGRYECCEMCGFKLPRLDNKGLVGAHIISENDGGKDHPDNALVLCRNCAESFDTVLKPKIYKAFNLHDMAAPKGWERGEGRTSLEDEI